MSGFKLIAIQVLDLCYADARKILPLKGLYQFYSHYDFETTEDKEVVAIKNTSRNDLRIYDIPRKSADDLQIDISAIVGKNGSGKSTILELIYAFCLCISKDLKDIRSELNELEHRSPGKYRFIDHLIRFLNVEIFFEVDGLIKSLKYDGSVSGFDYFPTRKINKDLQIQDFCYSIAINYSIYGLNEINSPWLSPMFHKNDGYQAPLVINPYRRDGNIDINREYDLANSRLIQNISLYNEKNPTIINGQKLHNIEFSFEPKTLDSLRHDGVDYNLDHSIEEYERTGGSIYEFFNKISLELVAHTLSPSEALTFKNFRNEGYQRNIEDFLSIKNKTEDSAHYIDYWFTRYIIRKIFKLCVQYSWLRSKYIKFTQSEKGPTILINDQKNLIKDLLLDKSHITLKIRQTLVLWKRRYFSDKVLWGTITKQDDREYLAIFCELSKTQVSEAIGEKEVRRTFNEQIDLESIPGGILKARLTVKRKKTDSSTSIKGLSSGEQQFVFTIQTVIYHLKNLDSVFESSQLNSNEKKAYPNILIILDEVELYFHPEFQRIMIFELLSQIKLANLKYIRRINILFSTHSPFILSDIPATNILKLRNGYPEPYNSEYLTFGANIHDLLANDFFMGRGFLGEFAKSTINKVISNLNGTSKALPFGWTIDELEKFIDSISEPLIRKSLRELFYKKFLKSDSDIDEKIKLLLKQKTKT